MICLGTHCRVQNNEWIYNGELIADCSTKSRKLKVMERCIPEVTKSLLEGKSTETYSFVSKGITALRVLLKIMNVDQFEFEKKKCGVKGDLFNPM